MCVGQAASSAAVLLASGEPGRRGILPHARVLLHPPSTSSGRGALPDLEIQAKEIQRVRDEVDAILATHTGQDRAVLRADTSRDRIFTAQQAVAYGLVDEVVASRKVRVGTR